MCCCRKDKYTCRYLYYLQRMEPLQPDRGMRQSYYPLLQAVESNEIDTVRMLLEREQSVRSLDSGLCWAARLGYLPIVVLLVENGADPNAEIWGGFVPVIWATIFLGDVDVINYLISQGADVNHHSSKRKQTALHAAVIRGNSEIVQCLLEAGADMDKTDYLSKTPLLHAVQRNNNNCVKILLHYNCDVNIPGSVNNSRLSPLHVALLQSNFEITKMLILAGAKFEQTSIYQPYTLTQYYRTVEENLNMELRPVYLKQQCRVCIRHLLKPQFLQKLQDMELPDYIKRFLSMQELDWIG